MKLSLAISTQPAKFSAVAYKGQLAETIRKIKSFGYDGVELAVRDPKQLDLIQLESVLDDTGLVVSAIGTGQAYGEEGLSFADRASTIRQAAIQRIVEQIALGERLKAVVIIGLIRGTIGKDVSRDEAYHWLIDALREVCAIAVEKNVRLALEPINRYETSLIVTAEEGLQLLVDVGSPALGLLLDTFHMNIEEPSLEHAIKNVGDRIYHVHLADSNRWYPGAGHIDFSAVVGALRSIGYNGWLSAEIMPLPDADTGAIKAIETMRRLLG